jgi:acetate kinase
VKLDEQADASNGPRISSADSRVSVWVIPTDEELMIAQHMLALMRLFRRQEFRSLVPDS